jgi:hypothetical protein
MVDTINDSVLGNVDQSDAASVPSNSLEDVDLTAAYGDETEPETGDVSAETDDAPASENWEERFKGQQTVANQKAQEAQQYAQMLEQERQARLSYEQQLMRYEQAMYAQQLAASGMPQEQVQQQMQAIQAQRAFQVQQQQLALTAQQLSQREQVLYQTAEEAARPIAAHKIAEKYKVPMADILDLDSPAAMIKVAEAIAKARKSTKAQAGNANKFEGQGLGSSPVKPTADLDEAAQNFMAEARRRGFA